MQLPKRRPNDPEWNAMVDCLQSLMPIAGAGMDFDRTTRGTAWKAKLSQFMPPKPTPGHPFMLYKVSDDQLAAPDKGKTCYAVRSGLIELRSKWTNWSSGAGITNVSNRGNVSYWWDPEGGAGSPDNLTDDVETTDAALGNLGTAGHYFALEDISGIDNETPDGGVHLYGCYYAFWLEIADFTPNQPAACTVKCQRFEWESGPAYTAVPFASASAMWQKGVGCPAPVAFDDYEAGVEVIPLAILQLRTGNALAASGVIKGNKGIGVIGAGVDNIEPVIMQIQRDHMTNRFTPAGLSFRFVGEYNPRQYRTYSYGDVVFYGAAGDNTDPTYGLWIAGGQYTNGAAETSPPGSAFTYFSNINPPSVTNPP
jgi:hypothetical protein